MDKVCICGKYFTNDAEYTIHECIPLLKDRLNAMEAYFNNNEHAPAVGEAFMYYYDNTQTFKNQEARCVDAIAAVRADPTIVDNMSRRSRMDLLNAYDGVDGELYDAIREDIRVRLEAQLPTLNVGVFGPSGDVAIPEKSVTWVAPETTFSWSEAGGDDVDDSMSDGDGGQGDDWNGVGGSYSRGSNWPSSGSGISGLPKFEFKTNSKWATPATTSKFSSFSIAKTGSIWR